MLGDVAIQPILKMKGVNVSESSTSANLSEGNPAAIACRVPADHAFGGHAGDGIIIFAGR